MIPIEFQWLEECESTSRLLKDRGLAFSHTPESIASARQSAGVGRHGRQWVGLEGNLHYSVAIPSQFVADDIKEVIPLAVGVLVAEFLRHHTGLTICLKWPNDLTLDGKKIGGILCEASIMDGQMQGVIIGVGVNLRHAPQGHSALDYPAGTIGRLKDGSMLDAKSVAQELTRWFSIHWPKLSRHFVMDRWNFYGLGAGHSWYRKSNDGFEWFTCAGIDEQGHLHLNAHGTTQSHKVNSATHDFRWNVGMGQKILIADIGNTRTKLGVAVLGHDGSVHIESMASSDDGIEPFVKAKLEESLAPVVHCLSVNPAGFKALEVRLRGLSVSARLIEKKPVRLTDSRYDIAALGADRWALIEWLYHEHSRGKIHWPAMVVSCGTATTIDFIDVKGRHLGGFIMIGVYSALNALADRGAMLPKSFEFDAVGERPSWPTNSQTAMIEASAASTAAFIDSERDRLAKNCDVSADNVTLLVTGGCADLVTSRLKNPPTMVDEQLVLLGAALMAANGR
jgi:BirA family biotin operon repressor/biotin-[acetyl-CoA-carboxylase] ligase